MDTCGLVVRAVVHAASVQDRADPKRVLSGIRATFPQMGGGADRRLAEDLNPE